MLFDRSTLCIKRLAAGLSRDQLAEVAGISRATVRRIELGLFTPRPATALALAAALDLDVETLWIEGEVAA